MPCPFSWLFSCKKSSLEDQFKDGVYRNREKSALFVNLNDPMSKSALFFAGSSLVFCLCMRNHSSLLWRAAAYIEKGLRNVFPLLASKYSESASISIVIGSLFCPWYLILARIAVGGRLSSKLSVTHQHNKSPKGVCFDEKVAIVTGGNRGIGYETALQLCRWGATVCIGCRDVRDGEKAARRIQKTIADECAHPKSEDAGGSGNVECIELDLTNFESVKKFAEEVIRKFGRVDILVNNAGIMMIQRLEESNGFEKQFSTNHLGHFLLTNLLLNEIKKTNGRIITLSSIAHTWMDPGFYPPHGAVTEDASKAAFKCATDMNIPCPEGKMCQYNYSPTVAYGNSKVANIWFTHELQRRLNDDKSTTATAYSAHPGFVKTDLFRHVKEKNFNAFVTTVFEKLFFKSQLDGAATGLYLCGAPKKDLLPGGYYADCRPGFVLPEAQDEAREKLLWKMSESAVGITS